jgi:capsular exopolysaccharide synthesis family protein
LIPSIPGLEQGQSGFSGVPPSISDTFVPLRVSFLAAASMRGASVIVVTSASTGEGKSTITANLARSLALAGQRVTVVCADPERHRLERSFEASADIGLAQVLQGSVPLDQALLRNIVRNLSLLPCGRPTGSDVELSQAAAIQTFLESIRERSGFVLVDTPPVGDPDTVSLFPFVDSVLFVADCRHMHARRLVVARRQLDRMNVDLLGIVFNRASPTVIKPEPALPAAARSTASW